MHPPGERERERERARLQKGVWLQLRNSSRLKERTVWEERKRRERRRERRGFIGEEGKRGEVHGMEKWRRTLCDDYKLVDFSREE